MSPTVVAVVLNFNSAPDTLDCVDSLRKCNYPALSILVVDNASEPNIVAQLKANLSEKELLCNVGNFGFAKGNNLGIRKAMEYGPDYVLVLNNDTVVEPDFLTPLVEQLEADETNAVAGGTICYYPNSERVWFAGGDFFPRRAFSFRRHLNKSYEQLIALDPEEVTWLSGCMMLFRTSVLAQVGLFNEDFFMYLEDTELSLRIMKFGYKLWYVPKACIYHKVRDEANRPLKVYFVVRNRLLLSKVISTQWERLLGTSFVLVVTILKMTVWSFARKDLCMASRFAIEDYFSGRFEAGRGLAIQTRVKGRRRS